MPTYMQYVDSVCDRQKPRETETEKQKERSLLGKIWEELVKGKDIEDTLN